jgi:hypothetical protein
LQSFKETLNEPEFGDEQKYRQKINELDMSIEILALQKRMY